MSRLDSVSMIVACVVAIGFLYLGSAEAIPDSDDAREPEDFEECGLCGHSAPVVVRDVGQVIRGSVAIARWWALCQQCADLADAADRDGLAQRARTDLQSEGWADLVVEALVQGTSR